MFHGRRDAVYNRAVTSSCYMQELSKSYVNRKRTGSCNQQNQSLFDSKIALKQVEDRFNCSLNQKRLTYLEVQLPAELDKLDHIPIVTDLKETSNERVFNTVKKERSLS